MFSSRFFDKNPESTVKRKLYLTVVGGGTFTLILLVFCVMSIYWGALWKIRNGVHNLNGWIIDFDGGDVGKAVTEGFLSATGEKTQISWHTVPADHFPGGLTDVAARVFDERAWTAVAIPANTTVRLQAAQASADRMYNGSTAVMAYGVEARNENAYRTFIFPQISQVMGQVAASFAAQTAAKLGASGSNMTNLVATAPQVVTSPIGFTMNNIKPFDVPVATAVNFVGLIYMVILTFNMAMTNFGGRTVVAQLDRRLNLRSLIAIRLVVPFISYFFLSLFFALLSLAFQVPFDRKFGHAGFFIYWMLTYIAMLALGMALEALLPLLTLRFISLFLLLWIISNVSVALFPIEILPTIYRYGYATPFYNVSRAVRTIVFGTRNEVGMNIGILLIWVAISCVTTILIQWWRRRQDVALYEREQEERRANEKEDV
ncbi:hypothetical protein PUNSTDRAFT_99099 [Punctularia strigosozonata HHB-11173 SS5]|uniref:uncharacterized protein n=1 Tax=Punctularia strigosozonata (strain HHB-11173) TaxID=741275 RepID=UPI0004417453|nr:uncharacterized protein PUNSTDRAFT_99099 [Punctularia strigosozonata HHB-11173 SS5]EIN11825.1 hypothetical protein PUNSTDRAFT_99099 [Punctularia strigosozonata HHB-11173 SS5]